MIDSYIVTFEHCRIPEINLPIMSSAGRQDELRRVDRDTEIETNGVSFTIYDDDGHEFVKGRFVGPEQDRDVPLEIARIHDRDLAIPMRIVYADGLAYRHHGRYDCAVKE